MDYKNIGFIIGQSIADALKGGPTSGNYGHGGRPGERGGSTGGGGHGKLGIEKGASREDARAAIDKHREARAQGKKPAEPEKPKLPDGITNEKFLRISPDDPNYKVYQNYARIIESGQLSEYLEKPETGVQQYRRAQAALATAYKINTMENSAGIQDEMHYGMRARVAHTTIGENVVDTQGLKFRQYGDRMFKMSEPQMKQVVQAVEQIYKYGDRYRGYPLRDYN